MSKWTNTYVSNLDYSEPECGGASRHISEWQITISASYTLAFMFNATQSFRLFTSAIQFCAAIGKKSAGMTKVANPGGCREKISTFINA